MIPRRGAIEALKQFLETFLEDHKIDILTIEIMLRMARLVLDTYCFAYDDKYYQQIHGGAMGSAFRQVLANTYMFEWEQDLIEHEAKLKEIYGRLVRNKYFI